NLRVGFAGLPTDPYRAFLELGIALPPCFHRPTSSLRCLHDKRGSPLNKCLSTKRAARKPRGSPERRGKFSDVITISQRPAVVDDRAVPGHWEGDLIFGARCSSAIGTLV